MTGREFADRVHSTSPFGVCYRNIDTDEVWSNDKYGQIVGRSFDECQRIGWNLVIHCDDLEEYIAASDLLVAAGTPMNLAVRFVRPDGEIRWTKVHGETLIGPNGTPTETTEFVVDVTDELRTRAELTAVAEQLDRRNAELESSLDAFHDLRLRLTADGNYVSVWAGDPAILARPADQLIRTNISADFPPPITRRFLDAIRTTIETSNVTTVPFCLGDDDDCVHFEARLARVGVGEVMAVIRDVSEVRALENQLVHAHTMESVGRLAGGVAHDFNNVLHVIRGHASALGRHLDNPEASERRLSAIVRAVDRTSSLVDQLMLISRPTPNNPNPTCVDPFLIGLEPALRQLLGTSIQLRYELNAPGCAVVIDDSRFENVILNLTTNARDAISGDGEVIVRTKHDGADTIVIEFADNGIGMDPETESRSFDLFFSTKAPGVGTGLGLANTYHTVTEASGTIQVESAPDRGSTFTIELPCIEVDDNVEAEVPEVNTSIDQVEDATVLIVDDDEDVLELCIDVLTNTGYSVLGACSGADALALIDAGATIDVVLTDIVMPGMTGPDLAVAIQQRRSDLPVIFMSGYSATAANEPSPIESPRPFESRSPTRSSPTWSELRSRDSTVHTSVQRLPMTPRRKGPAATKERRPHVRNVLVVDDDADARLLAVEELVQFGFAVTEADDGESATHHIATQRLDLVILDLGLPGIGGLDVLKSIRAAGNLPVIVLTGRGAASDRVIGLELGADDYVVKPFDPRELVARVNAVLRRGTVEPAPATLDFGGLVIDLTSRDVWSRGELLDLTAKEFDLLAFMASSPRRVYTREQLLDHVWDSSTEWQDPKTVNEHIHRLRRKLEVDPSTPRWVMTMRGAGYRFTPSNADQPAP